MDHKFVNISDTVSIPIPRDLTPEEEASYIANRIPLIHFQELEAECLETLQLWQEGKLLSFEKVLEDLQRDARDTNGSAHE